MIINILKPYKYNRLDFSPLKIQTRKKLFTLYFRYVRIPFNKISIMIDVDSMKYVLYAKYDANPLFI